jgi:hypothetical protein
MSDFKFDINAKKVRIPNKDLIESLKKYVELKSNMYFSATEYNKWKERIAVSDTISARFGSWNKALQKIGVEGGHENRYSSEELIKNLETVWEKLGFPPSSKQIHKYGNKISEGPYIRIWGTVKSACEQLSLFHEGKLTREALLFGNNNMDGCYVYLMLNTKNEHYKIGISNSPEYREKTLQSEEPSIQLIISKKFKSRAVARRIEKELHKIYSHKRRRGEWLHLEPIEVDEIKLKLK